jgi:hypothetical protein
MKREGRTTKIHIGFRLAADVVKSVKASAPAITLASNRRCARQASARRTKKVAANNLPGRET